jgi:antitoxin (DNA-binding transcriptional repressor) of toxin-antitoxin stability system
MATITIDDIQRDLLGYLQRVEDGETMLIVRDDKLVAELKPVKGADAIKEVRPVGLCAGEFTVPNDFDAPLPDDILDAFEAR